MQLFGIGLLIVYLTVCNCAKILGIFPVGSKSQFFLGNAYLRALADVGHNVTMVSPFEDKTPTTNGSYTNIVLHGIYENHEELGKNFYNKTDSNPFLTILNVFRYFIFLVTEIMNKQVMRDLITSQETYDVVVVNQILVEGLKMFAYHFNAHLVVFNSGEPNFWINSLVRNPSPPSYISEVWLGYPSRMTIFERTINVVYSWYFDILMETYMIPEQNKIMKKYFPKAPHLNEIIHNTSLVLVSSHESLNQPIPYVPNMIPIGGFHVKKPKALPNDLQNFLDNAKEGVIYFSMGSNLLGKYMPKDKLESILKTFGKFKHLKVLWKYEDDKLFGISNNVKISKWVPQNDVLAHPNIKVFITQAGYLSTTEALYHAVPIIAIPIMSDQTKNARNSAEFGFCITIQFSQLSEDSLTTALHEILQNPKYSEAVKARSKIFHDRYMNPTDVAVWWTEYIIRHNGSKHLRVSGLNLPWYSYYSIDVYSVIMLIIFVLTFVFIKFCFYLGYVFKKKILKKIKIN